MFHAVTYLTGKCMYATFGIKPFTTFGIVAFYLNWPLMKKKKKKKKKKTTLN